MKKKQQVKSELGSRLLLLTFGFLFLSGIFGVGTVWMRKEIARTGAEARELERRLVELERHEARVSAEIARSFNPAFLEMQNQRFELNLRPAREHQIVRVSPEAQERFARMRQDNLAQVPEDFQVAYRERN